MLHATTRLSAIRPGPFGALASADLVAADRSRASRPFDYADLKGRARALAGAEYRPPQHLAPDFLRALTYDQYQAIRFRHDHALWAQVDGQFRLEFFHCGRGFKEPVDLYEIVERRRAPDPLPPGHVRPRGQRHRRAQSCRRIFRSQAFACTPRRTGTRTSRCFSAPATFARVAATRDQFGLSARGLAIDTARGRRGVSALRRLLARAAGARFAHARVLCAARLGERDRRVSVRADARRAAGDRRRRRGVPAQADPPSRHRAADEHVSVRRERPPPRQ